MVKASDNAYPSILITEGTEPSAPAAGKQRLYIDSTTHKLKRTDSSGTDVTIESTAAELPGTLLGLTAYGPTSVAIYSCTNTAMEDVDATNMAVTFTAPASGIVLVRLSAWCDQSAGSGDMYWGLRESTTNLSVARVLRDGNTADQAYVSVPFRISGVTGGSHTYKWSFGVAAGVTHRIIVMDGSAISEWTPGFMEVSIGL